METCSPSKRRALAPLDSNALAPKTLFKAPTASTSSGISPVKMAIEGRKRLLEMESAAAASPAGKKACLGRDEDASERSNSPDVSSVFDTSANDASWATAATEHDGAATTVARTSTSAPASPAPSRGTLTRQQVRQRAETLRLRLSLANYKLRTGQTAVPLAELQRRPLLPRAIHVRSPTPPPAAPESDIGEKDRRSSTDSQRTEVMPSEGEEETTS
ncbi:hypothetical protein NW754_006036 [Fusarium falciforme]|uniref:Cyclin-dependent kinase n=2 Tax=Fusarium solani species complex TaxID=232080 RepID=A0A9W8RHG3_9HYPO|nr:hypothetical protein NCS57_00637800 [Fusarium keratoplasticum]KAJ4169888.1 hypothetical protein NW754_006036 [Fusarium falciforme]KAI8671620.1 hypothetical protein NCS57_00637800 [Fusarium keratoplasticum]KAJ4198267.1 hypothetical protein NW755_000952 [Fusarium falciforme]KAJ4200582.1 hypothetical protein NW767_007204 [Fusarium falciforme]KAJ4261885.1 hypothetical protein NW757_000158 [Fusarium falciforme]